MPEFIARDRLQPSLLDRLTDNEPNNPHESRDRRILSVSGLREGVLRDLAWLLNTTNLFSSIDNQGLNTLNNSVINYGIPDLSGVPLSGMNVADLERSIRQAIWDFEPRLIRSSVSVKAISDDQDAHNLKFEIEADMWALPYPERLYLKTELDLDLGSIRILDTLSV